MNLKNILLCLFFYFTVFSVNAETCKSYDEKLSGNHGGSLSLTGNICLIHDTYDNEVKGSISLRYESYSFGDKTIDGNFTVDYTADSVSPAPTSISLIYSGGPVNYTISGQSYEVVFKNLQFDFDGNMNQLSESGTLLLNGNTELNAEQVPYSYIKVF